jgi:hypothetical protein
MTGRANGVPEYWIADPMTPGFRMFALQNGVNVSVRPDSDGRLHSTVVPELVVDPAALLAGLGE